MARSDANLGWVKLHRTIRENPFYSNSVALHIWIECLLSASHEDQIFYFKRRKIELKSGQFIMGYRKFAKKINCSASTIHYWINEFVAERQAERSANAHGTIITVLNWDEYQSAERLPERQANAKRTLSEPYKNDKNDKNDKNTTVTPATSLDLELSRSLFLEIQKINPAFAQKFPTEKSGGKKIAAWACDFEKLRRIDNSTEKQIKFLINWLGTSGKNAEFWQKNILSGKKLREKFPQLVAACREDFLKAKSTHAQNFKF